jgi:hypothetical protein
VYSYLFPPFILAESMYYLNLTVPHHLKIPLGTRGSMNEKAILILDDYLAQDNVWVAECEAPGKKYVDVIIGRIN